MIKGIFFLNEKEGWVVGWPGIIFHTTDSGRTWKQQNSKSYNELYAAYFIDRHTGWVVGQLGEILHTLDGGKTWKFQRSGTQANLNKVYFADENYGLIVGDEGVILTTINGGVTWELQNSGTSNDLYSFSLSPEGILAVGENGVAMRYAVDTEKFIVELPPSAEAVAAELEAQLTETVEYHWEIIRSGASQTYFTDTYFLSALHGWTVGHGGAILNTTDGGKTWHPQQSGVTEDLQRIVFIDEKHGWIAGNRVLLRTENGGETWEVTREGLETIYYISAMHFINPQMGWIGANDAQTLHTSDGGKTFRLQKIGLGSPPIDDLHFINTKEGWAITAHRMRGTGYILHTVDGGDHWEIQARTNQHGVGVHFMNETSGWVVLVNGASLLTTDGGTTWQQTLSTTSAGTRLHAVKFRNHTEAWGIANDKKLLTTHNQGKHWEVINDSLGNQRATRGDESWVHQMAKEQFLPAFNVTNAHILADGQAWIVGAMMSAPRTTDDFVIDADEQVQDTIGQIYRTTDFGKNWYHQLGKHRNTLRDVLFLDEQHGWIAGDNGDLFSTEDGGQTWQRLESETTQRIVDVHFTSLEPKWGWLMLRNATLLYTQDGSQWTAQNKQKQLPREDSFALNDVAFGNFSEGWAVGERGDIIHNPDGGTTWARQRTSTSKPLTSVDMKFAPLGWAVGTNGVTQRTVNGGEYWKFHETHTGSDLKAVSFITKRKGWAAGRGGIILSTTDGGFTWTSQASGINQTLYDILALSEQEIYAVGASGTIIHSTDGGETWEQEHTGINDNLYAVTRVKGSDTLWAVGQLGVVLRCPKR